MHDLELNRLKDLLTRRPLTAGEREQLRRLLVDRPGAREAWQTDAALTGLLRALPDLPVSSNFAARVLQAADAPPASPSRWDWVWLGFRRPAVRFAGAALCLVAVVAGLAVHRAADRARMATSVASVVRSVEAASDLAQIPAVEILQDFEAIHRLSPPPVRADLELLEALAMN